MRVPDGSNTYADLPALASHVSLSSRLTHLESSGKTYPRTRVFKLDTLLLASSADMGHLVVHLSDQPEDALIAPVDVSSSDTINRVESAQSLGQFSLVIPAWNEEARLKRCLDQLTQGGANLLGRCEVVVVADGSTDATARIAQGFSPFGVSVISPSARLGKGRAVLLGVKRAKHSVVGYMDCDCPVPLAALTKMVELVQSYDCVIASRYLPQSSVGGEQPFLRAVASRIWRRLVQVLLGLPVTDTQCGVKFFRADVVAEVAREVAVSGWAFDASLLFHLKARGRSICEVPVVWRNDGGSKLKLTRVVPVMFLSLAAIRIANSRLRSFVPWGPVSRLACRLELGRKSEPE